MLACWLVLASASSMTAATAIAVPTAAQAPSAAHKAQADKAQAALEAGQFPEAIALFEDLVRQLPGEAGLHLNLGMALTMGGQPARAIPVLQKALSMQPDMLPAHLFLGLAQLEIGAAGKAIAPLEKVVAADRDNAYARQALGQAYTMLEQFDRAVEQYEVLRRVQPSSPQLLATVGQAYERIARQAFASLQELDPDSPHVWLLVADVLTIQENYPQAFELLRKAQAALPAFPGIHEKVADVYAATGHADWATAERAKAAAAAPDCTKLPVACAYLKGDYQGAIRLTRGATQAAALYWRARAANELAATTFDALAQLPPSVEQHLVQADIFRGQGRALPAAEELRKALALSPGNVQIERDLAGALFAARQADEALPLLEKLLKQSPDDIELTVGYAEMLVQTQQMEPAIPLLRKALAARPDIVRAHGALGRALMAQGDAAAALPHLEKALPTDEDGSLHYQLAQAYQRAGQADQAKAMLEKYQAMQQAAAPPASTPPASAPATITPPAP